MFLDKSPPFKDLYQNMAENMADIALKLRLGAVSSLLLVCYDAVFEVDDALCLTAESPHLSSLLLSQRRWCGKSFLECPLEPTLPSGKHSNG